MFDKIVIVTRRTRLEELVERFNTRGQARFYLRRASDGASADYDDFQAEDDVYRAALDQVRRDLEFGLPQQLLDRRLLPTYSFGRGDLIVTLGQDGLVANTAKYVGEQPIVGLNPEPSRFDGVLLPFPAAAAKRAVGTVLDGSAPVRPVTLAEAVLSDGQRLLAFNDLFIGPKTHVSARYRIRYGKQAEDQSSSGVLVTTGAGSTGWMSSVYAMARGIAAFGGGDGGAPVELTWEDRRLMFAVREPFLSKRSHASIVAGLVDEGHDLALESAMPTGGVIFSDGIEADFLDFNSGVVAQIRAAAQRAMLVVPTAFLHRGRGAR